MLLLKGSFSALKHLKTYLRSTMAEERLTGLALLHVNKPKEVDPDDIIEVYEGTQNSINLNINPGRWISSKFTLFTLCSSTDSGRLLLSTFIVFMTICNIICEIIKSDRGISLSYIV